MLGGRLTVCLVKVSISRRSRRRDELTEEDGIYPSRDQDGIVNAEVVRHGGHGGRGRADWPAGTKCERGRASIV